jgi:hypothetical protein
MHGRNHAVASACATCRWRISNAARAFPKPSQLWCKLVSKVKNPLFLSPLIKWRAGLSHCRRSWPFDVAAYIELTDAGKLKDLESEYARLKKIVAKQMLAIERLKEIAAKMYGPSRKAHRF